MARNSGRVLHMQLIGAAGALYMGGARVPPAAALRGGALRLQSTSAANPLLQQESLPRFDEIDATHVKTGITTALEQLEAQVSPTGSILCPLRCKVCHC